jgi:hypothetical protein
MINFADDCGVRAKLYRHCDGYPGKVDGAEFGVLPDLRQFCADVEEQCDGDNRYRDPEYLAAKFVVWQAQRNARSERPLQFLSLGVAMHDHGDIEYTYTLHCIDGGRPAVSWQTCGWHEPEEGKVQL